MKFADGLGWVNTRILLVIVYYLVITPTGLIMRLFGRSPLPAKKDATTYWKTPAKHSYGDKHFEKQF